jgi:membrane-bound serine protease (ClpP class)
MRRRRYVAAFLFLLGLAGALRTPVGLAAPASAPAATPTTPPSGAPADASPGAPAPPFEPPPPRGLPTAEANRGAGKKVVIVPIHGTIDLGLAPFVERILREHGDAALLVLDVDTFGGRVDAAVQIRDRLLSSPMPVLAFVNRRAISAGALISLAAHHIVFTEGATMGAATPVQLEGGEAKPVGEKMVSYMRSEMRSTAEARGRSGIVAEAMVDADVEIPGLDEKGKLLTLTTETAVTAHVADGRFETLDALLIAIGLEQASTLRPEPNWAENLARFFTDPTVSGLLMGIGMLGLLIEFSHPGFVLPGVTGVLCLALFFGGHFFARLAGWGEVIGFAAGLVLLGFELFVIPGFGIAGVLGITLIAGSLVMALLGLPLDVAWDAGFFADAMGVVLLSTVLSVVAFVFIVRTLPKGRRFGGLSLTTTLGPATVAVDAEQADWHSQPSDWARYLGVRGVAQTDLRLAGKARLGDETVDVVSESEYIDRGTPVRVIRVEGVRIVVVAVRDAGAAGSGGPPGAKTETE